MTPQERAQRCHELCERLGRLHLSIIRRLGTRAELRDMRREHARLEAARSALLYGKASEDIARTA